MIYFSKTTSGFYNDEINTDIPDDSVEISEEDYAALLAAQSDGKIITADANGNPVAIDRLPPTVEQLTLIAEKTRDSLLATAAIRIAPLQDAVDLGMATSAEQAALTAWKQYRVVLNRITQQAGFPAAIEWPEMPA